MKNAVETQGRERKFAKKKSGENEGESILSEEFKSVKSPKAKKTTETLMGLEIKVKESTQFQEFLIGKREKKLKGEHKVQSFIQKFLIMVRDPK